MPCVGRAAHSSCPDQGENAIYHMGHALLQLQRYAAELKQGSLRPATRAARRSTSGTIHGGICVNAVPDRCTIEIDRRLTPDEDPRRPAQQVLDWLAQHVPGADRLRHDPPFLVSRGLSDRAMPNWRNVCSKSFAHHGIAAQQMRRALRHECTVLRRHACPPWSSARARSPRRIRRTNGSPSTSSTRRSKCTTAVGRGETVMLAVTRTRPE